MALSPFGPNSPNQLIPVERGIDNPESWTFFLKMFALAREEQPAQIHEAIKFYSRFSGASIHEIEARLHLYFHPSAISAELH